MKVVILGAGQTGRGFLGRLAFLSNAEITYVDKDLALVEALNRSGSYQVRFFGNTREDLRICGYKALDLQSTEVPARISEADLILTSVLAENVVSLLPLFQCAFALRGALAPILVCENGVCPSAGLRGALPESVHISEAVVLCTTCARGLDICSQDLDYLPYDASGFRIPEGILGFAPEYNYPVLCKRKLYTYNCMSACICYLGAEKGYVRFEDAANDPDIQCCLLELRRVLDCIIVREYGVAQREQAAFSQAALDKFTSCEIEDSIERNARNANRKIGPTERIMGPLFLAQKYGKNLSIFQHMLIAAIRYGVKEGTIHCDFNSEDSLQNVLEKICNIRDCSLRREIINRLRSGRDGE